MFMRKSNIIIKTPAEIEEMRHACTVAARILDDTANQCVPGVTTGELDQFARQRMDELGAVSAFLGYRGFPAHICTAVNDEVVHGIPGRRRLDLGDIISIDVGVNVDGWIGDNARTVKIGVQDPEVLRLVRTAEAALAAALDRAVEGNRLSDISHTVEQVATQAGFSVVKEFVGHGVGRTMHEEPQIPNYGPAGRGPRLQAGMTLAVEPMINMGSSKVDVMEDGWTVLTRDRMPSVHVEHTVLVGKENPEILTCLKKVSE